jgi:uncharacterized membrane protein YgdD (TMEM256/DUF423 family)
MDNKFYSRLIMAAGFIGAFGVMAGAFGAHFLKSRLDPAALETIKTGVLYLFIHVLAILLVGLLARTGAQTRALKVSGISFILGIIMFSGSLFIIGTSSLTGFPVSTIGFITPIGGLFFITGWFAIAVNGVGKRPIH